MAQSRISIGITLNIDIFACIYFEIIASVAGFAFIGLLENIVGK